MFSVAQLYFQSDDFRGDVILHAAFAHPALCRATPSLQGGFPAAVFVFFTRTAGARIVAPDFLLCLAITFSLPQVLPLSSGVPPQNIRKSLSRLQRRRGSIFLCVPHRYRPCKGAFLDQDRARKLKPELEPTDCTLHRRIVFPSCIDRKSVV